MEDRVTINVYSVQVASLIEKEANEAWNVVNRD